MRCDRCYQLLEHGEHGLGLCPLEPRRYALALRQDTIEGGIMTKDLAVSVHETSNPDPKTYVTTQDYLAAVRQQLEKQL